MPVRAGTGTGTSKKKLETVPALLSKKTHYSNVEFHNTAGTARNMVS